MGIKFFENNVWKTERFYNLAAAFILGSMIWSPALADETGSDPIVQASVPSGASVIFPELNAERGRALFVSKGCVICHSVGGVGGRAAPAFDAPNQTRQIDIVDFAARMWRGSLAMVELQSVEFAYQIDLEGQELMDLAAFAYDFEAQKGFSLDEVPGEMKDWIREEPLEVEDDFFK